MDMYAHLRFISIYHKDLVMVERTTTQGQTFKIGQELIKAFACLMKHLYTF